MKYGSIRSSAVRAALLVVACVAVSLWHPAGATAPISVTKLDTTFGIGGVSIYDIGGPGGPNGDQEDEPFWMLVQPDGKYVTAGKSLNRGTGSVDFTILRYLPNGALDPGFGWNGLVMIDFVGGRDEAMSVALQPDGKLVVGGLAGQANGNNDFGLVRLNPNGSRDTTFGWLGLVMTDFHGRADQAMSVKVLPDGKILAGGYAYRTAIDSEFALARYDANGSRDATFGIGGLSTANVWDQTDALFKIAMQPDGKIVGVGVATRPDGNREFAVARFLSTGVRDNTFGWLGLVATDVAGGDDAAYAIAIQPDGRILAGGLGYSAASDSDDLMLVRYQPSGAIDTAFGSAGKVVVDYFGKYDQALWIELQPDGKIVTMGHAEGVADSFNFLVARFRSNGQPDPAFGQNGALVIDFFDRPDGSHAAVLHNNGSLVVTGDIFNPATDSDDFTLIKFTISDPEWVEGVVSVLPQSVFDTPERKGQITALLAAGQDSLETGNAASVRSVLQELLTHLQGCPGQPVPGSWIVDCPAQVQVRGLVQSIVTRLPS